jgi:hypothetical protein
MNSKIESFGDLSINTAAQPDLLALSQRLREPAARDAALLSLEKALQASYPNNYMCSEANKHMLKPVFEGIRECLSLPESEIETILKTN